MTIECPDEIQQLPLSSYNWRYSRNYWILKYSSVYHHDRKKQVQFHTRDLKVGESIGISIHDDGTLHYYINGIDRGICWDDSLPTNEAVYGVVDVYERHKKIRSLFHYGKYISMLT